MPPVEGDNLCAICLSSIHLNEKNSYELECKHVFHTDCIVKWFRNSNGNCPCCWNNNKKVSFYGVWERPYIDSRCKKLQKYSKKVNDNKLIKSFDKLNKKIDEHKSMVQELKNLKKNEEYIKYTKVIKDYDRKINNKDRTIMKMKINLISDFPVIVTN